MPANQVVSVRRLSSMQPALFKEHHTGN